MIKSEVIEKMNQLGSIKYTVECEEKLSACTDDEENIKVFMNTLESRFKKQLDWELY